jgi:hypothetical protein
MPPKKRPAATDATVSSAKRKKVGTSIVGEPDTSETHPPGLPRRSSIGEPTHSATATKTAAANKAKPEAKRSTTKAQGTTAARGRGRLRKDATAPKEEQQAPETPGTSPSKPVSRPKKLASAKSHSQVETATQTLKKAPRSPKPAIAPTPKPKGRPKSNTTKATTAVGTGKSADKPKGKPKTTKAEEKAAAPKMADEELNGLTANESGWDAVDKDEGKQYWLMKAEPDSRVENGVDVKFSIDDLMNAKVPEGWDGKDPIYLREFYRLLTIHRCPKSCGKEQNASDEEGRSGLLLSL